MNLTSLPILTVGSLAFDTIETPSGKASKVLGGSVNYFSIAASFYTPVQIVAVVGDDFPRKHLEWMSARNIDVSGVEISHGKTFHWEGTYIHNLNEARTLSTALNVFEQFNPKLSPVHQDASVVFLANIDPTLQQKVLEQTPHARLTACDTMNFWIQGQLQNLKKTLKKVDILFVNEGEATLLTQEKKAELAASKLMSFGPTVIVIKLGEKGACLFTKDFNFSVPAHPVPLVVDPTGAGDSFAGAFMGTLASQNATRELANNDPQSWHIYLKDALINGCVMASFTVEDFSINRLASLTKGELASRRETLLQKIKT